MTPLIHLLRGGPRNQAAACAAEALANLVANNGINQDAAADGGALQEVTELLSAAIAVSGGDRQAYCSLTTASAPQHPNCQLIRMAQVSLTQHHLLKSSCSIPVDKTILLMTLRRRCGVRRARIEAMKAVAALTDGSLPNQDEALQAGAPALLCQVAQAAMQSGPAAHPEVACRLPLPRPCLQCITAALD